MKKRLDFGKENIGGRLRPMMFDLGDIDPKWIKVLLYNNAVVESPGYDRVAGYIELPCSDGCLVESAWGSNFIHYSFIGMNYLNAEDVKYMISQIKLFFSKMSDVTVDVVCTTLDYGYKPDVYIYLYKRM